MVGLKKKPVDGCEQHRTWRLDLIGIFKTTADGSQVSLDVKPC